MSYLSYDKFMEECDKLLIQKTGLPSDDLPDWDWKTAWEEGSSFEEAVEYYLEDTGTDGILEMYANEVEKV